MVSANTREIYSEVYSVLNILGNKYIDRLPKPLYNMIKKEKENTYNPKYDKTILLTEQNIKNESLSIIALLHLNYWCESNLDKKELLGIFKENENKYQKELREKYNPDNIFKNKEIKIETVKNSVSICKKSIFIKFREWFKRAI